MKPREPDVNYEELLEKCVKARYTYPDGITEKDKIEEQIKNLKERIEK
jgi:translation elongation factor EF-1beta